MFNLEKSIAEWRRQMLKAGVKSPVPLEELESHLREDILRQMQTGLEAELAFDNAIQRIGQPSLLKTEFAKNTPAGRTLLARMKDFLRRFLPGSQLRPALLTLDAQESLSAGGKAALGFHHDFIGTEHVLLGLLELESGIVPSVLRRLGVRREIVRDEIEKIVGHGSVEMARHDLPYTPRVKKALQLAGTEARAMSQMHVGAEHVFLGLLREGHGVAALVLNGLGINPETARDEVLRELGRNPRGA